MENKMTNRDFYNAVINGNVTADVVEFAKAAIQKLDERNKARQEKLAPEKAERLALRARIANETEVGVTYTGAVLAEQFGVPQPKLNYQVVQLVNAGYFTKAKGTVTKGKGKVNAYTRTDKVYNPEADVAEAPAAE